MSVFNQQFARRNDQIVLSQATPDFAFAGPDAALDCVGQQFYKFEPSADLFCSSLSRLALLTLAVSVASL
jgi:hypothetical protein